MMLNWNEYRDQINAAVKEMSAANPELVRAYAGLHHANANSKRIDPKTRELIALAVAVTLRCDGCINVHTDAAIKAGDETQFTKAFGEMTGACNACHAGMEHPFLVIKVPEANNYPDQEFRP